MTDARKAIQFSVALVALGGFLGFYSAGERRIASERAANRQVSEEIERAQRATLAMPQLEAERTRLRRDLANVDMGISRTTRVAHFVRHTADVAVRRGVAISAMSAVHDDAARPVEETPVLIDVTLEGSYTRLLAALRDLSVSRVPASIDVASIARTASSDTDSSLTAQVRVTLGAPRALATPGASSIVPAHVGA